MLSGVLGLWNHQWGGTGSRSEGVPWPWWGLGLKSEPHSSGKISVGSQWGQDFVPNMASPLQAGQAAVAILRGSGQLGLCLAFQWPVLTLLDSVVKQSHVDMVLHSSHMGSHLGNAEPPHFGSCLLWCLFSTQTVILQLSSPGNLGRGLRKAPLEHSWGVAELPETQHQPSIR